MFSPGLAEVDNKNKFISGKFPTTLEQYSCIFAMMKRSWHSGWAYFSIISNLQ